MTKITNKPTYFHATALDVEEGDIILNEGYRCLVSNVTHVTDNEFPGEEIARYNLASAPDKFYTARLSQGYENMRSGGNRLRIISIQTRRIA